jgi:hypothetical protein
MRVFVGDKYRCEKVKMPRKNRPPKGQNPRGGKREGAGRPRGPTAFKHLRELAQSGTPDDPERVMRPVPVDPRVRTYHPEYGSPLFPAPGWKWEENSTTHRLLPSISDEPHRPCSPRLATQRLYRWHSDQGFLSLVREDDDAGDAYDDNLYTYDAERRSFFPPLPPRQPRQPEPPPRRRFFVRLPEGGYAPVPHSDEYKYSRDELYEFDAKTNQFVRVGK